MKLSDKDGNLWLDEHLLAYTYNSGDCNRISWPRDDETPEDLAKWNHMLAQVLFNAREMGLWDGLSVLLPDDTEFYPDENLE